MAHRESRSITPGRAPSNYGMKLRAGPEHVSASGDGQGRLAAYAWR